MANIHILNSPGGTVRAVVHFPTPAGNNTAGVSWATAVVNSGIAGTTILNDGDGTGGTISAAEKAQIVAGTVIERVIELDPDTGTTSAAKLALVDATATQARAEFLARLQKELRWFGLTR